MLNHRIALIHTWCSEYRLNDEVLDDLCHQIWIELAERMRTFRYDPGRTFRGWLRQFCHCRAIDMLRKQRAERARFPGDQRAVELLLVHKVVADAEDDDSVPGRSQLLSQAAQIQQAVKERVEPQTWQAFWRIAVEGCSFREAAQELGMSYAAVFAAHKRVARMLRAESNRCLSSQCPQGPASMANGHS